MPQISDRTRRNSDGCLPLTGSCPATVASSRSANSRVADENGEMVKPINSKHPRVQNDRYGPVKSLRLLCVEANVGQSLDIKENALANVYKTKKYVLANWASRHEAGGLHIYMRLGEALYCATVGTTPLCHRNIHGEYSAQFAGGSVTVKVVVRI